MAHPGQHSIWWGPPKKFTTDAEERKVSWLELFYDLVYVIVISRITHHLALHPDLHSIGNYVTQFAMIYWGWYNGSQYHDLHGSPGIRTRFMTLWQMMAVAALGVTLDSPPESLVFRTTLAFAFLQGFITYLWWSVGIYDKEHRVLSRPYVGCYFAGFILILASLAVSEPIRSMLFWVILVLNYLPPFLSRRWRLTRGVEVNLSSAMVERFGLLTIILFGENILGVVNGISTYEQTTTSIWFSFGLSILVVFELWWIFFSMASDRECKQGLLNGVKYTLIFIPALASLGIIGATFSVLLAELNSPDHHGLEMVKLMFGFSLSVFLLSIIGMSYLLHYPAAYERPKKFIRGVTVSIAVVIGLITLFSGGLHFQVLLLAFFAVLFILIVLLTRSWYLVERSRA